MPRAKGGSIPPPREVVPAGHGGLISTLNANDVLSGRGGRINNHPGNIMFRTVVEDYKHEYLDPRTRKLEKAHVAARLVAQIRSTNPPGRFLREDPGNPGKYVEIGDTKAWKKAGQALREDAPDVRKEIDEQEPQENGQANGQPDQTQQQPPYEQQRHDVPAGIPPSVSYSPSSQPLPPLPPPTTSGGGGGPRPDPPEAPGVTGYRQPPLRYFGSGRGGRGQQPPPFSGRGRGPPPHHQQQYHPHPGYGSHQHRNYFNHPPHGQHYPPGPQYQHPPPQFQHHPSQQYPPQHGPPIQHGQPQFMPPQDKQSRKKSKSPTPPGMLAPAHAVAAGVTAGVHQTMEAVSGVASKVGLSTRPNPLYQPKSKGSVRESRSNDFPPTRSLGTEFTMSDVSAFGESMKDSAQPQEAMVSELAEFLDSNDPANKPAGVSGGPGREEDPVSQGAHKQSSTSKDSSGKSDQSFTMSDLMGSNQTLGFGHSGRTRSFPDLMLSTGDLLPPLNDKDDSNNEEKEETEQRTNSGRILRPPFHRHSSSESSNVSLGFHPVRGRTNTALSGINDAMSIMSLDSRKSAKSESSSWLDNFKSMQSIHSDNWGSSLRNQDDAASVKSFLSDVSNELSALDLADPLLPPINMDSGLSDSDIVMARPDP